MMHFSAVPITCSLALSAMVSAGATHWWTVRSIAAALPFPAPVTIPAASPRNPQPRPEESAPPSGLPAAPALAASTVPAGPDSNIAQKEFFESLLEEIRNLRGENRDLRDQMAETNRDLMKLEFRVDTHSESFRPLQVNEEPIETTFESTPGVLPPKATPVAFPDFE